MTVHDIILYYIIWKYYDDMMLYYIILYYIISYYPTQLTSNLQSSYDEVQKIKGFFFFKYDKKYLNKHFSIIVKWF